MPKFSESLSTLNNTKNQLKNKFHQLINNINLTITIQNDHRPEKVKGTPKVLLQRIHSITNRHPHHRTSRRTLQSQTKKKICQKNQTQIQQTLQQVQKGQEELSTRREASHSQDSLEKLYCDARDGG